MFCLRVFQILFVTCVNCHLKAASSRLTEGFGCLSQFLIFFSLSFPPLPV